jgi:sugar phosphate isomerase/epimerase
MAEPAIGVQLYSVRDNLGAELPATLERLAGMGFTHVEPYDILGDTTALERALTNAGVVATTAHAKITELDTERVLDAAAQLGIGTVLVPWARPEIFETRDGVLRLAEQVNVAAAAAADRGIRVGYHNHDFEFIAQIDGQAAWEVLVAELDEHVVLELDTHWASIGGADVFEVLERLRDRIPFLHLTNELPDEEDLPIRGVDLTGRKLEVMRFAAPGVELNVLEIVVDGDPFDAIQRNYDYFATVPA